MEILSDFDPWGDPLCTCPPKYSLNPYTGCQHACVYCYITSYIPNGFKCRAKKNLIARLSRDLNKVDKEKPISLSNSSDPYPPMEAELKLTRKCLELIVQAGVPFQIVTKGDLVTRDLDLLKEGKCVVSLTITTLDEGLAKRLEPGAPRPKERLRAMRVLSKAGIPVTLRADPIFPYLNEEGIVEVVEAAAQAGARHVTASTFKPRPDSWRRMTLSFPEFCERTKRLYFDYGWKHGPSRYLPKRLRVQLLDRVRRVCERLGVSFATCREGLKFRAPSCDGTHLIRARP